MADPTTTVRMTYRQLAEHFGIGVDSARIKATRHVKAGRWKLLPGNYPGAIAVVELPTEHLKRPAKPPGAGGRSGAQRAPGGSSPSPPAAPPEASPADAALLTELREALDRARAELDQERADRAAEWERWRGTIDEIDAARAAEIERLDLDRQAERERIRELVGKLIEDCAARDRELRERAGAAEHRAEFARAEAVQARAEATDAREKADRHAAQVERLTAALDRVHKDRDAEVEEFAALTLERDALAVEVKRLRRPWWRRLFR